MPQIFPVMQKLNLKNVNRPSFEDKMFYFLINKVN